MKVYIRSIHGSGSINELKCKVDYLDLSQYTHCNIYKVDISIDVPSSHALFNNITEKQVVVVNGNSITIESGFYTLPVLLSKLNSTGNNVSLITSESSAYHIQTHVNIDFASANEIRDILGYASNSVSSNTISDYPANITRGLSVVHLCSSIVNSDADTPLATIKIEDPCVDFHQTIHTCVSLNCNNLSYIDVVFRNVSGENISLNAENITVTMFIKCFEEFDNLQSENDFSGSMFNLTTNIPCLEDGKFDHKLDRPITLNRGKIVNANFLINGKIKNLSSDQEVVINNVKYVIPAGSYSLQMLLAVLNSKSSAVFSYVQSGKDAYKLTVSNCNHLEFLTSELANMLGFDLGIVTGDDGGNLIRYQLREDNCEFRIRSNGTVRGLFVVNGNYTEDEFFNALLNAIKMYVPDCTMNKTEKYYEFKSSETIEIYVVDDFGIDKYYWSQNIKYRKSDDKTIIPRAGYFYYNADVRFDLIQEYVELYESIHNKDHTIKITYSDGVSKSYILPQGRFTVIDFFQRMVAAMEIDTYFDVTYYRSTVSFKSKTGVSAYFTIFSQIKENLNLPTTDSTAWISYVSNNYHKGLKRKVNGTITVKHQEDNDKVYPQTYNGTYSIYTLMTELRAMLSEFIRNYYGVTDTNATLVYATPFGITMSHGGPFNKNTINLQFGGTLIDNKIISFSDCTTSTGRYFTKGTTIKCYWKENQNTHNINLGYTNLEGLKDGIIKTLKDKEYIDAVNPNIHVTVSGNTLYIDAPNSMIAVEQTVLDMENVYDPVITFKPAGARIYSPDANIKVTLDYNTLIIGNQTFTVPSKNYSYSELINTLNDLMNGSYVFVEQETYYELVHGGQTVDGTLFDLIEFTPMSNSLRFYYPDKKIYDNSFMYISNYPMNITNGFNLINVFTNLVETNVNNDNYLSSFVINNIDGINISNAGVKSNYSNSNKSIDRYIADSNVSNIKYYFTRENGEPFNINGQIVAGLEIQQD